MPKSKTEIIEEIKTYIQNWGGQYSDWYVGIASDPRQRLFTDHNVREKGGDGWIFRECENADIAREIERYFIDVLGASGGEGGGDNTSRYVYAYKKTSYTTA